MMENVEDDSNDSGSMPTDRTDGSLEYKHKTLTLLT